jgi:peptidoglycan/LPS O-acetylase OafA/YrhL
MAAVINRKKYFKGFNALRFYAALSVVVQHFSYSPHDWFGAALLPVTLEALFLNGTDAVNLFFVLSGFLITYLLLLEQAQSGKVNVRNFYVRRAFRIFPVYFVFILVALILLRPPYNAEVLLFLTFFMGNVAFVSFFPFPPFEHLWSIAVEEQYYLLAPIMARFNKHILKLLIVIILAWWPVMVIASLLPQSALSTFVLKSRYDLIALGAVLAYGYYHQWATLSYILHPAVRILAGLVLIYGIVLATPSADFGYTTLMGLAFAVLVYNIAASPKTPRLLESPLLEFMGKLSYSMYVYHPLFVLLFFKLFYHRLSLDQYQLIGYPVIIAATIVVSLVSYRLLESPFLRLKDRFKSKTPVLHKPQNQNVPHRQDDTLPVNTAL